MENYMQQTEGTSLIKHSSRELWHLALINIYRIYKILSPILVTMRASHRAGKQQCGQTAVRVSVMRALRGIPLLGDKHSSLD